MMTQKYTYRDWKALVDAALIALCSLDSECLPDYDFTAAYAAGHSPLKTARAVIAHARNY